MSRLVKEPSSDFIFILKIFGKLSERFINFYVRQHRGKWYVYTNTDTNTKKIRFGKSCETQQLAEDKIHEIKREVEEKIASNGAKSNDDKEAHSQA